MVGKVDFSITLFILEKKMVGINLSNKCRTSCSGVLENIPLWIHRFPQKIFCNHIELNLAT